MIGTVWDSINLALSVALLVVALAALHTKANSTLYKQRSVIVTLNAKRAKNSYTTTPIVNKPSGLETQLPPATYATSPSSLETVSKLITLKQETPTAHSQQHTEDATPAGVTPHYPTSNQPDSSQTANTTQ